MKTDWTLYIYRRDRRCKTGERLFSITVWPSLDRDGINRTVNELYPRYQATQGWRMEAHPRIEA